MVAFFFWGYLYLDGLLKRPITLQQKNIVYTLQPGESQRQTLCNLQALGIIKHCSRLYYYLRFTHKLPVFHSGYYRIQSNDSLQSLMQAFKTANTMPVQFTIIPGNSWSEVEAALKQLPYVRHSPVNIEDLAKPYASLEGLLLANTYQTQAGRSDMDFLKLARASLEKSLQRVWQNRDGNLPYKNPYELLILASIVEREAHFAEEKPRIASVMINRIQKNMPLQMDSTIQYAKSKRYNNTVSHQDLKFASAYNTYLYRGLPPTPIAMVSEQTLEAMAHPEKTGYLYFVAKGDGHHQFSENYRDQINAIKHFKRNPAK